MLLKKRWYMEDTKMKLRTFRAEDGPELMDLFYNTVHTVNAKDYTEEQLNAWAPKNRDVNLWTQSLLEHYTVVAEEGGIITGFGDLQLPGYLDRLYVHAAYQGRGIGSAICDQLEAAASGPVTTHASITARPFFEARGYRVIRQQTVGRSGVTMTNFVMVKE